MNKKKEEGGFSSYESSAQERTSKLDKLMQKAILTNDEDLIRYVKRLQKLDEQSIMLAKILQE